MSELVHAWPAERPRPTEFESKREQRLRHDLRQSLGAVMLLAGIIERNPLLVPEALERLRQIQSEADWMAKLLDSGTATRPAISVVDVGEVVSETWAAVAACAPCVVRLVREPRALAVVDPVSLRRSARNLIENAVRAVGDHGCVEVRVLQRGNKVVVEVADSGPGFGEIPAQQGLGLVTVRRFVTRSGGRLSVDRSELGGALVGIHLPAAAEEPDSRDGEPA
ncbi:MAG TPA: HAMP domain-containing sensor histidine kinase [Nocardioidaceae bacterium]|nr:HAMP domain-containing sensor histidine kinase [Nocardioidaceae bacterium]